MKLTVSIILFVICVITNYQSISAKPHWYNSKKEAANHCILKKKTISNSKFVHESEENVFGCRTDNQVTFKHYCRALEKCVGKIKGIDKYYCRKFDTYSPESYVF
ncbi:uncharacterized protein LOC127278113 [Leptopilina boulardi]|uniref:uncharacterized protein LOC127278113 n=1 Tax=Leptopilina boulardi TaxID=63433 RepID=UPI0021F525D9|nr:uncharacterized protein LOC127278113 [Leptopilina boulardi]